MSLDFGNVLTRAWQIVWKHKVLWIFGIFAGCSRGGGGGTGGGGGGSGQQNYGSDTPFNGDRLWSQASQWLEQNWWVIVIAAILVLLIILLALYLGTIGRIALIQGTYQAEAGAERLSFGELFSSSRPYFWRVLGLSVLIGIALVAILLPIGLFGAVTAGVGFLCALPIICLMIPVAWGVSIVLEQANVAIVTENLGIADGVRRGWSVVRASLGSVIVMALILWILSLVAGVVTAIPIFAAFLPALFGLMAGSEDFTSTPFIVAGLCVVAYLPVLIVLSGIITAYVQSAWALIYMRLTKSKDSIPEIVPANA